MSHGFFNVVAEYPQVQHIPDEVHPAAMHEHGGEYRHGGRHVQQFHQRGRKVRFPEQTHRYDPQLVEHQQLPALVMAELP